MPEPESLHPSSAVHVTADAPIQTPEPASHFTYDRYNANDHLRQGDILGPTEELRSICKEMYKHFVDKKYNAFLVLTQTCDLVRRNGKPCGSPYINLAVVRPLKDVLPGLLDRECQRATLPGMPAAAVYHKSSLYKAKNLLSRIMNQNEQALGLFYLHPDQSVKISMPSVALLQVSIAIHSKEYYDILVASRKGSLKPVFRDRLGWLIGNLFSRVATEDMPPDEMERQRDYFLNPDNERNHYGLDICWISDKAIKQGRRDTALQKMSADQIIESLVDRDLAASMTSALNEVRSVLQAEGLPQERVENILRHLTNNPRFQAAFK